MMGELLDPKEMAQLTGYKTNTDQIKWLRDRGFVFLVNARNVPVVSRIYCRQRLSGKAASVLETEPDFSQVKK